jgi:hypothetical protein
VGGVRTRIIIGVGTWLLGTAAATGVSLLVVSRLGVGIVTSPGQLTGSTVNHALASEASETPTPLPSIRLSVIATPITRRSAHPASPTPIPAQPSPQPIPGIVLTSLGGTVVASCAQGGAYLLSWSPQQGYRASGVARGPAATAQVTFNFGQRSVTMLVSCSNGVPSATIHVPGSGGGGDE